MSLFYSFSDALWKRIHTGGFHKLLGSSFKRVCERKTGMLYKILCSIWDSISRILFCCFHVGRYCPPCSQALKALVRVIDEDPVFVLVVGLRVITCCHWERNRCEMIHCLTPMDYGVQKPQHAEEHSTVLFGNNFFSLCEFSTFLACMFFEPRFFMTNILKVLFSHFCHCKLPNNKRTDLCDLPAPLSSLYTGVCSHLLLHTVSLLPSISTRKYLRRSEVPFHVL